ncbi:hypothetical protein [Mesorhizobium sp.]|uniref:hypothetical protein n=1 Tax=Mesorhizobium sp. TaxID=1871066 RepID=UPI001211960A|nr:hypothetical protein [Mesorhizobium sp.]TIQ96694.1 MAG: hypothetical protein E5X36_19235 [Mesorhizobium sp.]
MIIRTTTTGDVTASTPLNKAQATALTRRIRQHIDAAWEDITRAYEGKAWKALGYGSWEAYVKAEFDMSRRRSYQLIDQGRVIQAISEATGKSVQRVAQIPARDVEAVKDDLPAVSAAITARVEQGAKPEEAAANVIAERRAEKDKAKADRKAEQAEFDRQRDEARAKLPDAIKQSEAAKEAAIAQKLHTVQDLTDAERIAELEETVRILEGDIEKLKAENAKFGDMKVLFDQGGFEAVIAAKDEQIRVLNTRVSSESADKASWAKSAGYWKAHAEKLGYTSQDDIVIPLDGDEFGGVA